MGYTHHEAIAVTGSGGFAVGSATAGETRIINSAGNHFKPSGTQLDTTEGILTWAISDAAGSNTTLWWSAPYACTIAGWVAFAVSSGTGRNVSVVHGSAGDNALSTTATGVTGTVGAVVALTASADVTLTANEVMRVTTATCATAQNYGVTITLTKT